MSTNSAALAIVDRLVVAYNSRSTDVLRDMYLDEVTYWSALEDTLKGKQAVIDHVEHLHKILPDEQMRAKTVTADDDVIVVEFESIGTDIDGCEYRIEFTEVFSLIDGKIASIKVYLDTRQVAAISH